MQRRYRFGGLALVALVTAAPPLRADIRVEVEGQLVNTYASGAAIDLTTAQLAAVAGFEDYDFIRVYDESTIGGAVPTADIGPVTITLSSTTTSLNPELRVLIASPSESDFSGTGADPTLLLLAGARDFRSLTIAAESNSFYTLDDLRDSIRLAAAVTRNVGSPTANPRDRIEVGQIFRLQAIAGGTAGPLSQANIHADVSAYVHDFHHGGLKAIEYVTASNSLTGAIEAVGDLPIGQTPSRSSNYSSIEKVVVGANNSQAAGITGDILARLGSIGFIYSTGPIGTAGQGGEALIEAGDGIR